MVNLINPSQEKNYNKSSSFVAFSISLFYNFSKGADLIISKPEGKYMGVALIKDNDRVRLTFTGNFSFAQSCQLKNDLKELKLPADAPVFFDFSDIKSADISFFQLLYAFVHMLKPSHILKLVPLEKHDIFYELSVLNGINLNDWYEQDEENGI